MDKRGKKQGKFKLNSCRALLFYLFDTNTGFRKRRYLFNWLNNLAFSGSTTLVGKAIGMLGYIMKGYLHGGTFDEDFIASWKERGHWEEGPFLDRMIDFSDYCRENLEGKDKDYDSFENLRLDMKKLLDIKKTAHLIHKDLLEKVNMQIREKGGEKYSEEPPIFSDFSHVKSSFHLVFKGKDISYSENLFQIPTDFEVSYTLNFSLTYQNALKKYRMEHFSNPPSFNDFEDCHQKIAKRIHDHMAKFPLCKRYISMLGLIRFFSSYFLTLKRHNKVPEFSPMELPHPESVCPSLFPRLPYKLWNIENIRMPIRSTAVDFSRRFKDSIIRCFSKWRDPEMEKFPWGQSLPNDCEETFEKDRKKIEEEAKAFILDGLIQKSIDPAIRRDLQTRNAEFISTIEEYAEKIVFLCLDGYKYWVKKKYPIESVKDIVQKYPEDIPEHVIDPDMRRMCDKRNLSSLPFFIETFLLLGLEEDIESTIQMEDQETKSYFERLGHLKVFSDLSKPPGEESVESQKVLLKIPGTCRLELKEQKVSFSEKVHKLLYHSKADFIDPPKEQWTIVQGSSEKKEAMFRLSIGDTPKRAKGFQWMENLLYPKGKRFSEMQMFFEAEKSIHEHDTESFHRAVEGCPELLEATDSQGRGLLHFSVQVSNLVFSQTLLEKGGAGDIADKNGYTPMHYAAMSQGERMIRLLFRFSPHSLDQPAKRGTTPLFVAIQENNLSAVRALLSLRASLSSRLSGGYAPLHSALHLGDTRISSLLIDESPVDVCLAKTDDEETALSLACELDEICLAEKLIEKTRDISGEDPSGYPPLDSCIRRNSIPHIALLSRYSPLSPYTVDVLAKFASIEAIEILKGREDILQHVDDFGNTVLIQCVKFGNVPGALSLLPLMNRESLNHKNIRGESALSLAVQSKFFHLAEVLLEMGVETPIKQLILDLCRLGLNDLVKKLLKENPTLPQEHFQDFFSAAIESRDRGLAQYILSMGIVDVERYIGPNGRRYSHALARINDMSTLKENILSSGDPLQTLPLEGGKTLPYIAAENGSYSCLKMLLKRMKQDKISLEGHYNGKHLLLATLVSLPCMKLVLDHCKDPNIPLDSEGRRLIHCLAESGSKESLLLIEERGADLFIEDRLGRTALFYALKGVNFEELSFLLSKNGPISAESLYLASVLETPDAINLLIENGANLNQRSSRSGETALTIAIKEFNLNASILLISKGASILSENREGFSPLTLAAFLGQKRLLLLLLDKIENAKAICWNGWNCLHIAAKEGHDHCIYLLLSKGFDPNDKGKDDQKTAFDLAQGNLSVLHALGSKNVEYEKKIASLTEALSDDRWLEIPREYFPSLKEGFINSSSREILFFFLLNRIGRRELFYRFASIIQDFSEFEHLRNRKGEKVDHILIPFGLFEFCGKALSLKERDHKGRTPLHHAVLHSDSETFSYILKRADTEDLEAKDKEDTSPLLLAINLESIEKTKALLSMGSSINQRIFFSSSFLHFFLGSKKHRLEELFLYSKNLDIPQIEARFGSLLVKVLNSNFPENERDELLYLLLRKKASPILKGRVLPHLPSSEGFSFVNEVYRLGLTHFVRYFYYSDEYLSFLQQPGEFKLTIDQIPPIYFAALSGKTEILQTLQNLGLTINEMLSSRREEKKETLSLLQMTLQCGHVDTAKWLIDRGEVHLANRNERKAIFESAILSNNREILKLFVKHRSLLKGSHIENAICTAIQKDFEKSLEMFYDMGMPLNLKLLRSWSAIHLSSLYGSLKSSRLLSDRGSNLYTLNERGELPIELAAQNDSSEQFSFLFEETNEIPDTVNEKKQTLLHLCAKSGKLKHAALLIDYGFDLDYQDRFACTPLHEAVKNKRHDLAKLLLHCGADFSIKNLQGKRAEELIGENDSKTSSMFMSFHRLLRDREEGETYVHLAVRASWSFLISLLSRMEDINKGDAKGNTPLHLAVKMQSFSSIRLLKRCGADINAFNNLGQSVLGFACETIENPKVLRFLIHLGADVSSIDSEGRTLAERLNKGDPKLKQKALKTI